MNTFDSHQLGLQGEQAAIRYLTKKGFRIIETNWLLRSGTNLNRKLGGKGGNEIDIIAYDGPTLVFVEVKTRRTERFGHPESAVNRIKQQRIFQTANSYIRIKGLNVNVRFDIISIVGNSPENFCVTHLPNAFFPTVYRR